MLERKAEKLNLVVGGIQNMVKYPGAIVIIDIKKEATAVHEANALEIPVIGIVDTNSNPKGIDYIIPANDDAIKSIDLLVSTLSVAIKAGYDEHKVQLGQIAKEVKAPVSVETSVLKKDVVKKAPEKVKKAVAKKVPAKSK